MLLERRLKLQSTLSVLLREPIKQVKLFNNGLPKLESCIGPTNGPLKKYINNGAQAFALSHQGMLQAQIEADLKVGPDGAVELKESDSYSLNLAPITVQLPGGERVPFLFTIKARKRTTGSASQCISASPSSAYNTAAAQAHASCAVPFTSQIGAWQEAHGFDPFPTLHMRFI